MLENNSVIMANRTESLDELNTRFADALLPLTVTFGVFAVAGVLGNLLILVVFTTSRAYRKNNFKIFVMCLAVIDLVTCISLIPAEMVKQRNYFNFDNVIACKSKCFFNVFGASASCLVLLVISVDRFRKAVLPMKKQLSPSLAIKVLLVTGFVLPAIIAVPGTIMCGIKRANKTNEHGSQTEIYLCATEDKYRFSIWRLVYKFAFIIILTGVSITYVVLYTFVLREVRKQLQTMALQNRKYSSYEVTFSSDIYESNAITQFPVNKRLKSTLSDNTVTSDEEDLVCNNYERHNSIISDRNGSISIPQHGSSRRQNGSITTIGSGAVSRRRFARRNRVPYKTIIWFILTIVFIVTYTTHTILTFWVEHVVTMTPGEFSVYSFFFRIYFFNHFINPVIYAIFVKRFRQSCANLFPMLKAKLTTCRWP